ncbi:MAG: hypothetical protein QOF57_1674, partial [Frankiaceae bacterium]|nr:hypothetical protein [Frankiaceae bacterium]
MNRTLLRRLGPLLALALLFAALPAVPAAAQVDTPQPRTLYKNGPSGRILMGGQWLFRLDKENKGLGEGFMRQTTTD